MNLAKTFAIGITAAMLLIGAPQTHAQSQDDLALMQTFLDLMTDYYELIESTHDIASDSEKAAILQMTKIQEVYEERGDKSRSVVVFNKVLQDSKNQAIRNAAYLLLGELHKESGNTDDALELLRQGLDENIKASQ